MATPGRVSDVLFRRNMMGPSFGHAAASVVGLVLVEKVAMQFVLPPWAPMLQVQVAAWGRMMFVIFWVFVLSSLAFWGIGTLFAIPALLGSTRWKIQATKSLDIGALLKAMPLIVFNFFLGTCVGPLMLVWALPDESFDFHALPETRELVVNSIVYMVMEEVLFYYLHRWMHLNKVLYQKVHKLHHTWTAPVSYVAIYCNPLEHILCNLVPLIAGPLVCRAHTATAGAYIFAGLIHTVAVHSGYWWCDDNGMHDEHHAKFTVNYGVTGILDSLHGTYRLPAGAVGGPSNVTPSAQSSDEPGSTKAD